MIPQFDQIVQLPVADSTNDDAFELLSRSSNCIVWTCDQRIGRGSRGRTWISPPNTSLALSIGLNDFEGIQQSCYPLFTAILIHRILQNEFPNADLRLKWPNDILLEGRKLAGILCESRWQGAQGRVVLGVGINLRKNPALTELEKGYAVLEELGTPPSAQVLIHAIPGAFSALLQETTGKPQPIIKTWMSLSWLTPDTNVIVHIDKETVRGRFIGLDASGAMELRDFQGKQHLIMQSTDDIIVVPTE